MRKTPLLPIKTTAMSALALLSVPLATMGSSCNPEGPVEAPDALGDGTAVRSSVSTECAIPGVVQDALKLLCTIFSPDACLSVQTNCNSYDRQLFTGTDVSTSKVAPADWNGFGGSGEAMADALMCSMRELSPQLSGPAKSQVGFSLGIGDVEISQEIGFLDFDRVNPTFKGYRKVQFNLPVIGRFDAVTQDITLTKNRYAYVRYEDPLTPPLAGRFPIQSKVGVTLSTQEKETNVQLKPPGFNVPTPVGVFFVQPIFTYENRASVVDSPFSAGNIVTDVPNFAGSADTIRMTSLYGVNPGVNASTKPVTLDTQVNEGWSSQLALGNRDPREGAKAWTPPASGTFVRPDADLSKARSAVELKPTITASAAAQVKYPKNPAEILPSWIFSLPGLKPPVAEITVTPKLSASLSSQLDFYFDEGKRHFSTGEFRFGTERQSGMTVVSGLTASASFSITAGLRLYIAYQLPFPVGKITLVDLEASFPIPVDSSTSPTKSTIHALGFNRGNAPGTYSQLSALQTRAGAFTSSAQVLDYIQACYAPSKVQPQPAPSPTAEKGNPADLFKPDSTLWPCNICLYADAHPEVGFLGKSQIFMPATTPPTWSCNNNFKSGCMDLCVYDPSTNQLIKAKSAKEIAKYAQGKDNTFGAEVLDRSWINLRYDGCESPGKP